ncbi:MAG: hypothetical protein ACI9HK_005319, partial [Pirellulaceae bacterium]
ESALQPGHTPAVNSPVFTASNPLCDQDFGGVHREVSLNSLLSPFDSLNSIRNRDWHHRLQK